VSLAAALLVAGAAVTVPGALRLGDARLEAAGCGVRSTLWVEHYVAALYLPGGMRAVLALADPASAKALYVRIMDDDHLPARIPREWREPIARHLAAGDLARARAAYRGLAPGDELIVAYEPGAGVRLVVNGRVLATSPGHALVEAVLSEWAGDAPPGEKLRATLERNVCAA
jgi:hypothetical protein